MDFCIRTIRHRNLFVESEGQYKEVVVVDMPFNYIEYWKMNRDIPIKGCFVI